MQNFDIVIGCDCDPDRKVFNKYASNSISWDGLKIGIKLFKVHRKKFFDETGLWPKMTWFVRSDTQIKALCGSAGYCLEAFRDQWDQLLDEGDEIAWHPHLYFWDNVVNEWVQKIDDESFTLDCLEQGYSSYKSFWSKPIYSVHGGWCYQDNTTIKFFSDVGILADCSAIPGHNTKEVGKYDKADWFETTVVPYWISKSNYKYPALSYDDSTKVIQIPTSVGKSLLANTIKDIKDQFKRGFYLSNKKNFDYQVPLMSLNSFLNKDLLKVSIQNSITYKTNYFLSYFHADECLPKKKFPYNYAFSLENIFKNIKYIVDSLEKKGYKSEFKTVNALANIIKNKVV